MQLLLARHAQPQISARICYGVTNVLADKVLTAQAAQRLADTIPQNTICRFSPLLRCQQLAEALAGLRQDLTLDSSANADHRLIEMDFGVYEGKLWTSIAKSEMDKWVANFGWYEFGGKECVNHVMRRVQQVLQEDMSSGADNVLWITHAGVIRAASILIQGIDQVRSAQQWPRATIDFGSVQPYVIHGKDL